jgi:P27 family predicted phage terminase small subunit
MPSVAGRPGCPAVVADDPVALAEWERLVGDLEARGLLAATDEPTIAAAAVTWAGWAKAQQEVRERGQTIHAINGALGQNPAVGVAKGYFDMWFRLMRELGLSPASRAGLGEKKRDAEQDAFEQWKSRKLSSS